MATSGFDRLRGFTSGVAVKAPCQYRTTANITLSGLAVQAGGTWASPLTQDDNNPTRVLVMNQTGPIDNGIFNPGAGTWQRAQDFNGAGDAVQGTLVHVYQDATDLFYELTTASPVIGTSSLAFAGVDSVALSTILARLASTSSAADGAALLGYSPALAYASGLGQFLNYTFGKLQAETDAGVTPTNYAYIPADPRRYGAVFDGTTDDVTAFLNQMLVFREAGYGISIWPAGRTTVWSHGLNIPSKTTIYMQGCEVRATTTFSQGTIPAQGAISFFEVSHQTVFGADPDITDINIYGGGGKIDGRRDEQTGTIPGYTGISIETSDSPVEADLWKVKRVKVHDLWIDRAGFDGWYVAGAQDWEFRGVLVTYALRVGSVVIASKGGRVTDCDCYLSVGPNAGLAANMQGPSNSGDGWWNEPNNSWQDIDVTYDNCRSWRNYQSGFKPYNAGADCIVRVIMNGCGAFEDAWDEVTQARRSTAAEAGLRVSLNGTGSAKFLLVVNDFVADRFERSGIQIQRGAASTGDQRIVINNPTLRDCNLSNTNGNNRAPISIPAGAGKANILIKGANVIAPAVNTAGYGISIDGGQNVEIQDDAYIGTFAERRNIQNAGFAGGIQTVTASTATVAESTRSVICNFAGTVTLTLPSVLSWTGRQLLIRTITANAVISSASNVVPRAGGAAGTAILNSTAGDWAILESDGTSWQEMSGGA